MHGILPATIVIVLLDIYRPTKLSLSYSSSYIVNVAYIKAVKQCRLDMS